MKQTLTDQEIRTLAAIIQTCSQRGAFKAEEMVPVGTLFNRLIQIAYNFNSPLFLVCVIATCCFSLNCKKN